MLTRISGGDATYHLVLDTLRALPSDIDANLAAEAVLGTMDRGSFVFGRSCKRLPPPVIAAVLERLHERTDMIAIFIRECIRLAPADSALEDLWRGAIEALLDLQTTYGWGSKQRKAKLGALAASSRYLAAAQAVAVGCPDAPLDVLAVLAIDGSPASVDALLPHFVRATTERATGLDLLDRLRTHATLTAPMKALLDHVRGLLDARNAASPALLVARDLGLGVLETFWFWAFLGSAEQTAGRVPRYQCNLEIDSREALWFRASVSDIGARGGRAHTWFDCAQLHHDDLALGSCGAVELGAWLERAARTLGVSWSFDGMGLRTGLRGKKRELLVRWLSGG